MGCTVSSVMIANRLQRDSHKYVGARPFMHLNVLIV